MRVALLFKLLVRLYYNRIDSPALGEFLPPIDGYNPLALRYYHADLRCALCPR